MAGALQRYRVIEFGQNIAGPVLGMLLADQGADVVKIEPLDGDPLRGDPAFSVWNRGKRSVALDLTREQDKRIAQELLASADVVIENQPPGTMESLGLDYEGCRDVKGDIIYVTLPDFHEDHPDHGKIDGDLIVSASTGLYVDKSQDDSDGPSFISVPYAGIFGAMVAAPAVAAALFHRERTGEGQLVQVPIYDAMFTAMGAQLVRRRDPDPDARRGAPPIIERFYKCKDGRWVNINAGYPRAMQPMLKALGHPEWIEPLSKNGQDITDPEERRMWSERLTAVWLDRTALEWEAIMDEEAGMPCTMCRTIEEWMDTAQAQQTRMVIDIDDPTYGPMRQVGIQVRLSETPGEVRNPAPKLGEHTESVIAALGSG